MKYPLILSTLLLLSACGGYRGVNSVTDGDTFTITIKEEEIKLRLKHVDCPERKGNQPHWEEAREYTRQFVDKNKLYIAAPERDFYGRFIADVRDDEGEYLNRQLVEHGLCWWYEQYSPNNKDFEELQDIAKQEKRGLWADKDPLPPWIWRTTQEK